MTAERKVTKRASLPLTKAPPMRDMAEEQGLVEVVNNQRGRDQAIGWGVYRGGKIYIVGSSKQHALLNLNAVNILNIPSE